MSDEMFEAEDDVTGGEEPGKRKEAGRYTHCGQQDCGGYRWGQGKLSLMHNNSAFRLFNAPILCAQTLPDVYN